MVVSVSNDCTYDEPNYCPCCDGREDRIISVIIPDPMIPSRWGMKTVAVVVSDNNGVVMAVISATYVISSA
jgi:hypothetical protein